MASIDDSQVTDYSAHRAIEARPEIADLLGIVRRGWLSIVAGVILGLTCALIIVSIQAPIYKASSRIAFERTTPRYMQTNKVTNEPIIDDYDALAQTYVISSENILLRVVRSLSLANDPDFAGGKDSQTLGSRVRGLFRNITQALGSPKDPAEDHHSKDPEKIAFDTVVGNLTVSREDVASVLTISFSWKDPAKAATIANAIVDAYINDNIAEKIKSTDLAGRVAQERVAELKEQAKDAERALLEYKMANNIVGASTTTASLSGEQLAALQTHLTNARVAMADAKARMQQFASDPVASILLTPDDELIKKLRAELLDLSVRETDIENLVGRDHLAAVKLRDKMDGVRQAIASEQKRIAGSFANDYELARVQYDELSGEISQLMGQEGANSEVQARMRELQAAADTLRSMYDRMLQQSSEMNRVEAQPYITPDARILVRATPPSQTESSKKRWLILAGGSVMGLLLGGAITFARSFPFGVFRTSQQVTRATGLPCAVLPAILSADEQACLRNGEYVLERPY